MDSYGDAGTMGRGMRRVGWDSSYAAIAPEEFWKFDNMTHRVSQTLARACVGF